VERLLQGRMPHIKFVEATTSVAVVMRLGDGAYTWLKSRLLHHLDCIDARCASAFARAPGRPAAAGRGLRRTACREPPAAAGRWGACALPRQLCASQAAHSTASPTRRRRFGQLYKLVRVWAQQQGINDASRGTLNSWPLALLVLFHLQTRPRPILPPVSKLLPEYGQGRNHRYDVQRLMDFDNMLQERQGKW
jgi:hypothetical protein